MLAVSAGMAVLRGGRSCRHRCDDRDRAVLGLIRDTAIRVLRAALLRGADLLRTSVFRAACGSVSAPGARGTCAPHASAADDSFLSKPSVASIVGCVLFLPGQQGLLPLCCQLRGCMAVRPHHARITVGAALNPPAAVPILGASGPDAKIELPARSDRRFLVCAAECLLGS